jgi:hypothetical protein
MPQDNKHKTDPDDQPVPSIEEERDFLARCEYVNRMLTTAGRMARKLLRDRGWDTVWCDVDQEQVWRKTFSPEDTQHLDEWDAFYYEQDHTRQFFRDGGIPVSPRKRKA